MELYIEMYSEKSFAVFGETKAFKDTLKSFNGRFNTNLKGKAGWIFGLKQLERVSNWIKSLKPVKTAAVKQSPSRLTKTKAFDKTHEFYEAVVNSKEYNILEYVESISFKSFHAQTGYSQKDLNISHRKRIRGEANVLDSANYLINLGVSSFAIYTESEVADLICETFLSTPTQSALIKKLIARYEGEKEEFFASIDAEFENIVKTDCPF